MAQHLSGKVAIVTGASRGIGRAIAERLAADGASVVVNYAGSAGPAAEAVAAIEQAGGQAVAIQADVSRISDIERLFAATIERFGQLDILVNNAGVMVNGPVSELTEADFDRQFGINVKGTFFCCQAAARHMAAGGRIINFSSSTTVMMIPGYAAYCATKGAVEQLTHVLAKELGPRGITVNTISPGPVDTELFSQGKTEEQKQNYGRMAALGRLGQPADIAAIVSQLAGPDFGWVTGQNLRANGGLI